MTVLIDESALSARGKATKSARTVDRETCRYNFGARKRIITPASNMVVHEMTRGRQREREREWWIESAYINKPREKTPKIIPACEEINSCGYRNARGREKKTRRGQGEQEWQGGA